MGEAAWVEQLRIVGLAILTTTEQLGRHVGFSGICSSTSAYAYVPAEARNKLPLHQIHCLLCAARRQFAIARQMQS